MPKRAYECLRCNEVHENEDRAEECCRPEVGEVWLCDVCDGAHDDEPDAEKCCAGRVKAVGPETVRCPSCGRHQALILHAVEIEVAGHCSECNPHYSIDDAFRIGDLLEERVAEITAPL